MNTFKNLIAWGWRDGSDGKYCSSRGVECDSQHLYKVAYNQLQGNPDTSGLCEHLHSYAHAHRHIVKIIKIIKNSYSQHTFNEILSISFLY